MKSEQQSVLAPRNVAVFNIGAYWEMNNSFLAHLTQWVM
jgi:hypothetical protein